MKKIILIISVAVFVLATIGLFVLFNKDSNQIDLISAPNDISDMITVVAPIKDSKVASPLSFAGRARGSWFFEGSFPVVLTDANGKVIAEGHASAQGDWMTGEFVKFIGSIQFNTPDNSEKGKLIFKRDNPSGLPENDASYEIPVVFK